MDIKTLITLGASVAGNWVLEVWGESPFHHIPFLYLVDLYLFKNSKWSKGCHVRKTVNGTLPLLSQLLELRAAFRRAASLGHQRSLGSTVLLPKLHYGPGDWILTCCVPLGWSLPFSEPQ